MSRYEAELDAIVREGMRKLELTCQREAIKYGEALARGEDVTRFGNDRFRPLLQAILDGEMTPREALQKWRQISAEQQQTAMTTLNC